jgi:hypothetical protein
LSQRSRSSEYVPRSTGLLFGQEVADQGLWSQGIHHNGMESFPLFAITLVSRSSSFGFPLPYRLAMVAKGPQHSSCSELYFFGEPHRLAAVRHSTPSISSIPVPRADFIFPRQPRIWFTSPSPTSIPSHSPTPLPECFTTSSTTTRSDSCRIPRVQVRSEMSVAVKKTTRLM